MKQQKAQENCVGKGAMYKECNSGRQMGARCPSYSERTAMQSETAGVLERVKVKGLYCNCGRYNVEGEEDARGGGRKCM